MTSALAAGLFLFQLWAIVLGSVDPLLQRAVFLSWIAAFAFLSGGKEGWPRMNAVLAALSGTCGIYYAVNFERILWRWPLVDPLTGWDLLVAAMVVVLVGELTRRHAGWAILLVATGFSLFLLFGDVVPGTFSHRPFSTVEYLDQMVFTINGILGAPLAVAATYVYLFILLGFLLYHSGGGDFFVDLARRVAARTRGGPAKVAVCSCGLFGMMSGSPTSDAVTTGTFTIPLMRRSGYREEEAGAIVAAAATGGSIMPPVMGSAAFIMVEITGIPYVEIIAAAAVPALLFYLSILAQVHFRALRSPQRSADLESPAPGIARNLHFLIPIAALVFLLLRGETPIQAASIAIAATVLVSWLRPHSRLGVAKILQAIVDATRASVVVAAATASAGIVVAAIAFSGIGGKVTGLLLNLAAQHLFPVLLLAMSICIILGMGMPVPSAYILTAVLLGPALASLGLPALSSHLFMIYFAVVSAITPPVAVAAYAVAGLTGGNPSLIGFKALRLALVALIIPFCFIYQPALLLLGRAETVLPAVAGAAAGVVVLASGLEGWLIRRLLGWERPAMVAAGLLLLSPGWATDLAGAALAAAVWLRQRR